MNAIPESTWLITAEIAMDGKVGFMNVTLWALSQSDAIQRLETYLGKYDWVLLSTSRVVELDPTQDHGEELNGLLTRNMQNRSFIGLGTYFSYPPN